jgi:ABC-type uncharacterized transport system auxiliary subunit
MRASENRVRLIETMRTPAVRIWKCRRIAALGLLAAVITSCGSPKPVHYFTLTHPPTTGLGTSQAPFDATLLVRLFQTSHIYRDDRIVYGDDGVQIGLYDYERWTQPPADLLQDALARGLRSSGQFRAVTTLRSDANVDYYLAGQLYSFREVTGANVAARLNFEVQLIDLKKMTTIWRHTYNHDEPSAGKTVQEIVMAMDKNVHQAVQEVQDGLVQALTEYNKK